MPSVAREHAGNDPDVPLANVTGIARELQNTG
jgi:hypothetical protein